jgi:hypothetical protein
MQSILLKRNTALLFFALASVCLRSYAQTYNGNVELTSQSAVNSWDPQWKTVTGNIYIVGGAIIVSENHSLLSLDGLSGLQTVGAIEISYNGSLNNLNALGSLTTVSGSVNIVGNESLTSLTGLAQGMAIGGDLTIRNNPVLSLCNVTPICHYQRTHSAFTYLNVSGNAGFCTNELTLYSACNGPLPVVLTEFDATGEGSSVRLRWATAAETNASHFDIERSRDGRAWQKAGLVTAKGESLQTEQYFFSDAYPLAGENLYRLRMTDRDETFSYSRVRSVYVAEAPAPAFPNPFSSSLSLSPGRAGSSRTIELTDSRGTVIYKAKGTLPTSITTAQWEPGTYLIKLTGNDGGSTQFRVLKAQ